MVLVVLVMSLLLLLLHSARELKGCWRGSDALQHVFPGLAWLGVVAGLHLHTALRDGPNQLSFSQHGTPTYCLARRTEPTLSHHGTPRRSFVCFSRTGAEITVLEGVEENAIEGETGL